MKMLFLAAALFALPYSSFAKAGSDEGGWSSSGNGEYIVTQNNPWFMSYAKDKKPVTWCIDHGGPDKFSLSLAASQVQIQSAISTLTKQLEEINIDAEAEEDGYIINYMGVDRSCGVIKDDSMVWAEECNSEAKRISHIYQYVSSCEKADIEFILGDSENENVKKLIAKNGAEKFKKLAAIAIRTDYSETTLKGKGFIYIAADLGEFKYSGERNMYINGSTIWDKIETMNPKAPFPITLINNYQDPGISKNLKLKNEAIGPLMPIAAHEFGHILGLGHNHNKNIMDEDYPANLIRNGFTFKGNFARDSQVLSRGLLNETGDHNIGFDMILNKDDLLIAEELKKSYPKFYRALFADMPKDYGDKTTIHNFLEFSVYQNDYFGSLSFSTLEKDVKTPLETIDYKYKRLKSYVLDSISTCGEFTPSSIVTLRYNSSVDYIASWIFDEDLLKWIQAESKNYSKPNTVNLLSLGNVALCGTMTVRDLGNHKADQYLLEFELHHNYYQGTSSLKLIDPDTGKSYSVNLMPNQVMNQHANKVDPSYFFETDEDSVDRHLEHDGFLTTPELKNTEMPKRNKIK